MNDPKAAAAYHPGDAPVTRPDLDALIAWLENMRTAQNQWGGYDAGRRYGEAAAALAAEWARADQAERDVTNAENDGIRWMKRAQEAEQRIADALSCLRASSVPLGMTEVMFQDRLITEARRVPSVAPTAEQ